tara:strand:+ start:278 stop:628 length:351 start_codon:yes stop_codon:yes gene_type:complete
MALTNNTTDRPWGSYEVLFSDTHCKIKKIIVNPGHRLSYQYHNKRSETWVIVEGIASVTLNGIEKDYVVGENVIVPLKAKHRVENKLKSKLVFIEVQTGQYFGEDDIVRIQDDYGR